MHRRAKNSIVWVSLVAWSVLSCDTASESGPQEIHWDRDVCSHCNMSIGDRRHAAQLRVPGDAKAHFFDDPGCALVWLDARGEPSNDVEVWVRDPSGERWIDARLAHFRSGATTPMGYGFATADADGELSLDAVAEQLRSLERERRHSRH